MLLVLCSLNEKYVEICRNFIRFLKRYFNSLNLPMDESKNLSN